MIYLLTICYVYCMGLMLGYILWAPMTPFKQGFIDAITFKFLRKTND